MLAADGKQYDYPEWDSETGELPDGSLLFISDARGVYIPRDFAQSIDFANVANVSQEDWDTLLAGPDGEWYWEAWSDVENNATVRDTQNGKVYAVRQDGDCWLIPLVPSEVQP